MSGLALSPCPCCQSTPKILALAEGIRRQRTGEVRIECQDPGCGLRTPWHPSLIAAIAAWNRRSDPVREELAEALAALANEIEDTEEHGAGADEDDCPICRAIKQARAALARAKGEK